MTLYLQSLRQSRLAWLIWVAAMVLYIVVVVSAAPAVRLDPRLFARIMAAMPARLLALFGGSEFLRHPLLSYLDAKLLGFLPLFGALLGAFQAAGLARELEGGRCDFLLSLPVRRSALLWARLVALWTSIAAFWLVTLVALGLAMQAYGFAFSWLKFSDLAYAGLLADMVLGGASLWAAGIVRTYRDALRLSLGIAVLPLLYDFALRMALVPRGWRFLLPYGYYDPQRLLLGHAFAWAATCALIPAAAAVAWLAQRGFEGREV